MTIADCAAGREKTANLEGINDPAFIILFVGMLVLEAITIRLCDMNCYPIPPMGTTLVKTQQVVHVPPSTHLWTGRKKPKAKMARAMVRWMYVLTVGFCRLLPRRVMALSIWGKAKSSFSLVKGVIVAREDAPEEWPHPLPWFAISLSQLSCLGVRAGDNMCTCMGSTGMSALGSSRGSEGDLLGTPIMVKRRKANGTHKETSSFSWWRSLNPHTVQPWVVVG